MHETSCHLHFGALTRFNAIASLAVMSAVQIEVPCPSKSPSLIKPPRKRRRRAPATGAAADCFTCSDSGVKCDRRRPYCSQCLDKERSCAGYKTTLTWGIGVASRGKLRGLSLPVLNTQHTVYAAGAALCKRKRSSAQGQPAIVQAHFASTVQPEHISHPSPASASSESFLLTERKQDVSPVAKAVAISPWQSSPSSNTPPSLVATSFNSVLPAHSPSQRSCWTLQHPSSYDQSPRHHVAHPSLTSGVGDTENDMASTYPIPSSVSHYTSAPLSYPEYRPPPVNSPSSYENASSIRWTPNDFESCNIPSTTQQKLGHVLEAEARASSTSADMLDDMRSTQSELRDEGNGQEVLIGNQCTRVDARRSDAIQNSSAFNDSALDPGLSLSIIGIASIGKTARMRYLISYFAEVISPVIVAFDSPSNPYRTHMLRLASESETLQHAISALSASNLRQRKETGALSTGRTDPARRSSMAHLTLTDKSWQSEAGDLSAQDQLREENFHKGFSIRSLNAQLADPSLRKDDSILATLLILCLFHACDSGVAKFQIQFAGVKKLLSVRGQGASMQTDETAWITRMFTWFDAMSATVNDREGQLRGVHVEDRVLSEEDWTLESLAGCDGRLFKTISRLGGLNVLSQKKFTSPDDTQIRAGNALPFSAYSRLEDIDWAAEGFVKSTPACCTPTRRFWHEWEEVRHSLGTWQAHPTTSYPPPGPELCPLAPYQQEDLTNISESFRYSALLYIERLASPQAASSDLNIQAWVQQSLSFIKRVRSDVYLLWPLFITGSECVSETDRRIIRERCLDIQRDSGFVNNYSCLEVLEKIWNEKTPSSPHDRACTPETANGFRFASLMKLGGDQGEYMVV